MGASFSDLFKNISLVSPEAYDVAPPYNKPLSFFRIPVPGDIIMTFFAHIAPAMMTEPAFKRLVKGPE